MNNLSNLFMIKLNKSKRKDYICIDGLNHFVYDKYL